jgi:hypothetical protein
MARKRKRQTGEEENFGDMNVSGVIADPPSSR